VQFIVSSLLNGLSYGLLLFMLSSGLTLIFSMMSILNFAHAAFYMLGVYCAYQISAAIGFWSALVFAPLLVGVLGVLIERYGLCRAHRLGPVAELLFTFGLSFLAVEAVRLVWGCVPLLAVAALCLASFTKDFAMAASWSTCLDIGHRYSGTVAGFMNMVGNLGTVVSPPVVAWLASGGNWHMALWYSAAMFLTAALLWAFINPRRVIVYTPEDRRRLREEGALD